MGAVENTGEYPPNWKEIARKIKDEADWRCVRCDHEHDPPAGYCLTVHHLDGNKSNCSWWNLPALCQRCHLHIQAKVDPDQDYMFELSEWIKPYIAGRRGAFAGRAVNKGVVMRKIEEYLKL